MWRRRCLRARHQLSTMPRRPQRSMLWLTRRTTTTLARRRKRRKRVKRKRTSIVARLPSKFFFFFWLLLWSVFAKTLITIKKCCNSIVCNCNLLFLFKIIECRVVSLRVAGANRCLNAEPQLCSTKLTAITTTAIR
jgi:hypothetical protein